jgi:hypothetical protein
MGMNTASITAKMRVPNQSISVVIFTPGGSIYDLSLSALYKVGYQ